MSGSELDRPLRGEPLGLDLLNTVWRSGDGQADLFDRADGVRSWLAAAGLTPPGTGHSGAAAVEGAAIGRASAGPAAVGTAAVRLGAPAAIDDIRTALITARTAIRGHADDPGSAPARDALNDVLGWGRSWPILTENGVTTEVEFPDPARGPGWLAAASYAELFAADPARIRRCAHPSCILYFYDTSPKRGRRWCSMATCGNRAKAARHYARSRGG